MKKIGIVLTLTIYACSGGSTSNNTSDLAELDFQLTFIDQASDRYFSSETTPNDQTIPNDQNPAIDIAIECITDGECDDDNECTDDKCLANLQCEHSVKIDAGCNDNNKCTYDDKCSSAGICEGTPISCTSSTTTCGIRRSCNGTSSCTESYPSTSTTCSDSDLCTASDHCDGKGNCIGTLSSTWSRVVSISYYQSEMSNGTWATEQHKVWNSDRKIKRLRIAGDSDDGGYCYAHWGSGHIEKYRHDGKIGYDNVNSQLSLNCPTPSFDHNGNVSICQLAGNAGTLGYGIGEITQTLNKGTTIHLRGRHVMGKETDHINCYLEINCQ